MSKIKITCPVCGQNKTLEEMGNHVCKSCELELSKLAVKQMKDDGWCEGCKANFDDCYKDGVCKGSAKCGIYKGVKKRG